MSSRPLEKVRAYVQRYQPELEPIIFEEPLPTSEIAAQALGVEVGQIAKSILFRAGEKYAMFVAAGDVRIHSKRVKAALGSGKTKMASPEEVVEVTGYQVGAVCPFALEVDVPIFVDRSLQRFSHVYTAAGVPESLLPVTYEVLLQMTGAEEIDAASAE
ncbi:cys-tRNA(pro)/cys-tRNA(cys) deacylase [Brevibacillus reuszeri]|uniref:Cys-tRNA(Pro)/cys-tRNA(Cys) deacylase n=1 Tax=Brevibacillus reuszeri TaxID=54915 RepID=A0A0K9Z261_9BACL|nr:YbaK/EbsC family protein [Brevibacillus reuszeri]KNB74550.1 prolyl-tRNA synthetase [Brevibacillus reuszeri]MED1856483.1 YbaK/EbsC family protein [Brevibacillus reuszeri]GED67819.1 cys-tRNA(pro)/cys-tRNA(cys) deacylase [Brevibacillus reuszeri]